MSASQINAGIQDENSSDSDDSDSEYADKMPNTDEQLNQVGNF